jgi:glutathione S-transferase
VLRLITIPISHYCEKARWALDRAGLDYREERHVQGIHRIAARRAGGGTTVPVLVTPERVIGESLEILEWVDERTPEDRRLFPEAPSTREEVKALCFRFDDVLGPTARRLIYFHVLPQHKVALKYNDEGVPHWEDRALHYGWPLADRFMRHVLDIHPGVEALDESAVFGELDFVAQRLADGREYLCGERFGAADLTFAALAAAVLLPPQYGTSLPQPDILDPTTASLVNRAREHPAGQYALELFAENRRQTVA